MSLTGALFSVLMVGHSLFGQQGPAMLDRALDAAGATASVQAQIINGAPLGYNWQHSDVAEGVDARKVLSRGQVSHLILTEAIPLANHLQWSETERHAAAFAGLAFQSNPAAKVYVQETWHSLKSGTGAEVEYDDNAHIPWRTRLSQDLSAWQGIITAVQDAHPNHRDQIALIPAGQALGNLSDSAEAGRVPGLSSIAPLFDDDIHLSALGHYFVSLVQYGVLTGQNPEGVVPPPRGLADGTAQVMQQVAWTVVRQTTSQQADLRQAPRGPPVLRVSSRAEPERTHPALAVGVATVADWSVQQPFLDLMKSARPWIGHLAGQWGGVETEALREGGFLDADGWPVALPREVGSLGTLILTDMPQDAVSLAGRYLLRFEGAGIVEVTGRAENMRYGDNAVRFDYEPGQGSVEVRIQRSDPANPVRKITVVREDRAMLLDGGALFNPDWTERIDVFGGLRFMDWMATNNSTQADWAGRPRVADAQWADKGVPVEVMVTLANELGKDPWFNMPHLADDAYLRHFSAYVAANLDPSLTAYVEYSNEVWNWQFEQTRWADAMAQARWGAGESGHQYYALRAAQMAVIWREIFADAPERLVTVISSQTGWLGLEQDVLDAPLVRSEGLPAPFEAFDAYAITGYFGGIIGTDARADLVDGWLDKSHAQGGFDHATRMAAQELWDGSISGDPADTLADLSDRVWPYHAKVAQDYGLDLIMYEGGTHIVGIGPRVDDERLGAFFQHLNYTPEMGALYTALLSRWRAVGGQMFNAYADVYAPTKWGSWGALRHLDDENPRMDALVSGR